MNRSPTLVLAYADNRLYRFEASERVDNSYFGGPLEIVVKGKTHGREPLHHIASLSAADIPVLRDCLGGLPLLYGLRYSGCRLRYQTGFEAIKLLEIEPKKPSSNWPYRDYPKQLPYIQLVLAETSRCSWKKFAESLNNPPGSMPGDLVVVVPPPMNIGMSVWGRSGDLEGVQLVWEFDAKTQIVRGYNSCT